MSDSLRIGAYVLAADPTWIKSSIGRYSDLVSRAVITAPGDGRGWTGAPVESEVAVAAARAVLLNARVIRGSWVDPKDPVRADTAQRTASLEALGTDLDWVLQIDTDEILPNPLALVAALRHADSLGIEAVEWPMRTLFARTRQGDFLEVVGEDGSPRFDYPGPIAVKPGAGLSECRRTTGTFLRPVVGRDATSLQLQRAAAPGEMRWANLQLGDAILHNSWARDPGTVRRKIRSWSHHRGVSDWWYYAWVWRTAPWRWRHIRDFHPFARGLWPKLGVVDFDFQAMLHPADKAAGL